MFTRRGQKSRSDRELTLAEIGALVGTAWREYPQFTFDKQTAMAFHDSLKGYPYDEVRAAVLKAKVRPGRAFPVTSADIVEAITAERRRSIGVVKHATPLERERIEDERRRTALEIENFWRENPEKKEKLFGEK